jgi:hypothetical protein
MVVGCCLNSAFKALPTKTLRIIFASQRLHTRETAKVFELIAEPTGAVHIIALTTGRQA